jgi:hypothetical protein
VRLLEKLPDDVQLHQQLSTFDVELGRELKVKPKP